MKKWALVAVCLSLAGAGAIFLRQQRCRADQELAFEELLRFGIETRAFAFDINRQGYLSPAKLVRPSDDQPSVRLLPSRYLLEERGGYRFTFEGRNDEPPERPWRVAPAFRAFDYSAVPLAPSCASRSFLLSSETMAVHYREDGTLPTTDDAILQTLDGASLTP